MYPIYLNLYTKTISIDKDLIKAFSLRGLICTGLQSCALQFSEENIFHVI